MTFGRIFLWIVGLVSVGFGLAYLLAPEYWAGQADLTNLSASGVTDVRATYGGFQIGMGLFLVWSALDPSRIRSALFLVLLSIGAVAGSRLLGVLTDDSLNDFHTSGLLFEATLTVLAAVAFLRTPERAEAI